MRARRIATLTLLLASCAGAELRCDPSPSCSYRDQGSEVPDAGMVVREEPNGVRLGQQHGCVMLDGDALCWGSNALGQLSSRIAVPPGEGWLYDDWRGDGRLTLGGAHSCAHTRRQIACWGNNSLGQLGDGRSGRLEGVVPVRFDGVLPEDAPEDPGEEDDFGLFEFEPRLMSSGFAHTCVSDGVDVYCWGEGGRGQLGRPVDGCCARPEKVLGLPAEPVRGLAAGAFHTCVLLGERPPLGPGAIGPDAGAEENDVASVHCFGDDRFGALGDGEPGEIRSTPMEVALPKNPIGLAAGAHHTCVVLSDYSAYCFGRGMSGELGDGRATSSASPVRVAIERPVVAAAAGGNLELQTGPDGRLAIPEEGKGHTCVVDMEGHPHCFGNNDAGQLGTGSREEAHVPTPVVTSHRFSILDAGGRFTCGIGAVTTGERGLYCWGANDQGQLGRTGEASTVPELVMLIVR